jgi:hypothetical protein
MVLPEIDASAVGFAEGIQRCQHRLRLGGPPENKTCTGVIGASGFDLSK